MFSQTSKVIGVSFERTKNTIITPLRPVIIYENKTRPLRSTDRKKLIMLEGRKNYTRNYWSNKTLRKSGEWETNKNNEGLLETGHITYDNLI